jgi:hypothetical protein
MNTLGRRDATHVLHMLFEESTYLWAGKVVEFDVHAERGRSNV